MDSISTQTPAIDKANRIFHFIAENGSATYSQIYQGLSLPQSSTSALLSSLIAHGLLRQNEGKYYLGFIFFEFGNKAIEQFNIKELATEPLLHLRDQTQLACHLGILDGHFAIYLAKVESPNAIVVRSWLGKRLSLYSSSLGKVLLAWLPENQIDELLPDDVFPAKTKTTITTKVALKKELEKVRDKGWAFDNSEDYEGVTCIAAPVFDHNNHVIAAISTSGVSFQMPIENIDIFANHVMTAASMLSNKIS